MFIKLLGDDKLKKYKYDIWVSKDETDEDDSYGFTYIGTYRQALNRCRLFSKNERCLVWLMIKEDIIDGYNYDKIHNLVCRLSETDINGYNCNDLKAYRGK